MKTTLTSKSKKRYYLHSKLKALGTTFNAFKNTIYVPYGMSEDDLNKPTKILRDKYGYNIEVVIPEFLKT